MRILAATALMLVALSACGGHESASPSTATTSTTSASPLVPAPTTWQVTGQTPLAGTASADMFCLEPDPPAPCDRYDGQVDVGTFTDGTTRLDVRVHYLPLVFDTARFERDLARPMCGGPCHVSATTVNGRAAWVVEGSTRSGPFVFLATPVSDAAFESVLDWCGEPCAPFPIERARELAAGLAPTSETVTAARWRGAVSDGNRTISVPAIGGRSGCDLTGPYTEPGTALDVTTRVVAPRRVSDLLPLCQTDPSARPTP